MTFQAQLRESKAREKAKDGELKETKAELKAREAAREKFSLVINALNQEKEALKHKLKTPGAAAPASDFRSLDLDNPNVTKFSDNVVSSSTNNCWFGTTIHVPPEEVFDAFFGDFTNATNKMLYQKVIEDERGDESVVLFWSFMVDQTKSCELALRLKKVKGSEGEIIIGVESVEEEELATMTLPNPHSTNTDTKKVEVGEVGDRKLIAEFKQDAMVDAAERNERSIFMRERWTKQVYSKDEVTTKFITSLTVVLGTSLIILVSLFFMLINGEYGHTFFSIETGGQMSRRNFLEGNDVMKADAFDNNETHWGAIKEKIEAWVKAGWKNWEQEKPEWFTDNWKAKVPEDMIPEKGIEEVVTVESEEKKDIVVTVEDAQGGRKSLINTFINRKKNNKVAPEGVKKRNDYDVEEFK
ncbi:hypothetical protein TrLO_g105 [Triparma laevis f. longispina]|uniref:Uncharacterized protein n=1 Tax=Triparma laevis f. longispina TaxID=1714387 RepID=A0A9W7EI81_9STRA|nr:hypothetical protein TrLO_g105 [Triparma laevis f. longispina]